MSIKVVVADDHKLFREGICNIVNRFEGIEVVGQAADGLQAIEMVKQKKPHILLLDIEMPQLNGLDTINLLRKEKSEVKVIMLSMHDGDNYIIDAIERGANGYLHKNAEPDEIEKAIVITHNHNFYFNEKANQALLKRVTSKRRKVQPGRNLPGQVELNETEKAVLICLCQELTSTEIAEKLYLSKRPVEFIRHNLFNKTGCKNAVGLAIYALRHGIARF